MRYCKKCVQPDTRPGITFDEEGVCYACRYAENIDSIDWDKRRKRLREIAEWAKKNSSGGFDCVVGVSGGKDSTVQALYTRDQLGLKTLLVNCSSFGTHITKEGLHNLENLVQHGFDTISYILNPKVLRAVTRKGFFEYGNPYKAWDYALYAVSYITALKFGIPLVVQGENAAITLGVTGKLEPTGDALNIDQYDTLGGGNASDWVHEGIELKDLLFYQFPDKDELRKAGIRAIFLGYYLKEWSYHRNTEFGKAHGVRPFRDDDPNLTGRLNPYAGVDTHPLQIVNQMLKYYKFGFGKVTDEVCYDIREGRMSREEAIELVHQYDGKCGEKYSREICDIMDITLEEFWQVVDRFVNRKLFRKDPTTGKWVPRFKVGYGLVSE